MFGLRGERCYGQRRTDVGEQGSDLTSSFLCSAPAWQAAPSAACRAWEITWRMQASGVCCPWAASISSSRALHTEGDTSSGSTKRNTLRAEVGGPGADEDDPGEEGHWRGTLRALQSPPKLFTSSKNRSFEFKNLWGEGWITLGSGGDCGKEQQAQSFGGGTWSLWGPLVSCLGKLQLKCRSPPQRCAPVTPLSSRRDCISFSLKLELQTLSEPHLSSPSSYRKTSLTHPFLHTQFSHPLLRTQLSPRLSDATSSGSLPLPARP